jgi:hypothetical protein
MESQFYFALLNTWFFYLLIFILLSCVIGIIFTSYQIRRNEKVYLFRMNILNKYPISVYEKLSSYDDMLESFKPLKEKYWIH